MRTYLSLLILSAIFIFNACTDQNKIALSELDLMSYDMPIVIQAPGDAEIKKRDLIVQKDITVKSGEDFYIQIFESDVTERDAEKIKNQLLKDVQDNPYFDELISEEANGFIYKTQIDSVSQNYGFRFVRIQGDKEYTFQTGLIGTFTLDQVRQMYQAVK